MTTHQAKELQTHGLYFLDTSKSWMIRHWFKIILLGFVVFVLLRKDISFEFSIKAKGENTAIQTNTKQGSHSIPASAQNAELGLMTLPAKLFNAVKAKGEVAPTTAPDSRAIAAHHLSFIINKGALDGKNVESDVSKSNVKIMSYIRRFAPVAMAEMRKYGIPASLTLAQALLDSNVGAGPISQKNHNHFQLTCSEKNCTPNHCTSISESHKIFYKKFNTAWESFRTHSLELRKAKYQSYLDFTSNDYKDWANGLQKSNYSKDPDYANKLILIIEALGLQEFD